MQAGGRGHQKRPGLHEAQDSGCESSAQQWAGELLTKDGLSGCEAARPPGPTLPWAAAGLPMNFRQERRRETDSRTSGSPEAQRYMRAQAFPLDPTLQGQLPPAGRRLEERILPIWIFGDSPSELTRSLPRCPHGIP